MLKILHIIPDLNKGGAERLVLDISNELSKRPDIEVKLITFRSDNAYSFLTESINWEVIPAIVTPSITGKTKIEIAQLQYLIKEFQPNIIHSHLFESEIILSQINCYGAKRIVHFHDNMVQFENINWKMLLSKQSLTNYFEKQMALKAYNSKSTKFIGISKDTITYLNRVLPPPFEKELLHNAIDTNRFIPINGSFENKRITIIGSLIDNKGQELAIRTIYELRARGLQLHLDILGDGPEKKTLKEQVNSLDINTLVHFHGNVDHPEEYLQNSFLYLHTAKYEAFGLVLLEAMSCKLPVVCTDGKGNRDLIQEGVNGFMVWERDPKLLADKIEFLLENDALRKVMGEKAREFAEGFGIEKYVDKLITIYKS